MLHSFGVREIELVYYAAYIYIVIYFVLVCVCPYLLLYKKARGENGKKLGK